MNSISFNPKSEIPNPQFPESADEWIELKEISRGVKGYRALIDGAAIWDFRLGIWD